MSPALSSRWPYLLPGGLLLSVAAAAATLTIVQPPARPAPAVIAPATTGASFAAAAVQRDPLWAAIDQWNALRQSDRLPFASYASFLLAHRGWPGEAAMRRAAERAILPDQTDPQTVAAYLTAFPPATGAGRVRLAEALASLGRAADAREAAALAWTGGALSPDDEARLTARFAGQFTPAEQDRRMERLLWDGATASAARQLPFVSPGRQPLYAARLAFQMRSVDAALKAAAAGPGADRDAGYVVDRAAWLAATAQLPQARAYLAQARTLDAPPVDPARFLQALLDMARGAAHDAQAATAYGIAAHAADAYPAGTDVSARPLAERDPYTSLVWLGGQQALKMLNRPADAERMFALYEAAALTPGTKARGLYWAGRAADAAGTSALAQAHYADAARNVDQFYGQLAAERMGRTLTLPPPPAPVAVSAADRQAFAARETVRAARLLAGADRWLDQTQFVRQIAADAQTDADHQLVDELARDLGRPDLAVMASRQPRTSGARDPIRAGFPTVAVPPALAADWTMIHAITRQESQFDREALSGAGARGLMQLMNATAKEQAGREGVAWDPSRLTSDPQYNVLLGQSFFDRMVTYYRGSIVLAVASYNAGPGNVNRFIRANGDPRDPGVDVVDWIEAIPLSETRGYVQKVLENAVIYDLLNPTRARTPQAGRLAYYLGKPGAG